MTDRLLLMSTAIDSIMQRASEALVSLDYALCETLCEEALAQARAAEDWPMIRRILLPLQEARRQKRQAALERLIVLGAELPAEPTAISDLIGDAKVGCVVFIGKGKREVAAVQAEHSRSQSLPIEMLFADSEPGEETWRITTATDPLAVVELRAPKQAEWVGCAIDPTRVKPPTPAHWFMAASEALGDAALAACDAPAGTTRRFDQLLAANRAVSDHEILHQRLADAAKALQEATR